MCVCECVQATNDERRQASDNAFCNHVKWQTRIFRMQSFCRTRLVCRRRPRSAAAVAGCLSVHVRNVERAMCVCVFVFFSYSIQFLFGLAHAFCEDAVFAPPFRSRFIDCAVPALRHAFNDSKQQWRKTKTAKFLSCVNTHKFQIDVWQDGTPTCALESLSVFPSFVPFCCCCCRCCCYVARLPRCEWSERKRIQNKCVFKRKRIASAADRSFTNVLPCHGTLDDANVWYIYGTEPNRI